MIVDEVIELGESSFPLVDDLGVHAKQISYVTWKCGKVLVRLSLGERGHLAQDRQDVVTHADHPCCSSKDLLMCTDRCVALGSQLGHLGLEVARPLGG